MILLFLLWTSVLVIFLDFEPLCPSARWTHFPEFSTTPGTPDVENGTHPLSGHIAVTSEQVGSETRRAEEQSNCEGWGWDGDLQMWRKPAMNQGWAELRALGVGGKELVARREVKRETWRRREDTECSAGGSVEGPRTRDAGERRVRGHRLRQVISS